jgi:hypothetical protein
MAYFQNHYEKLAQFCHKEIPALSYPGFTKEREKEKKRRKRWRPELDAANARAKQRKPAHAGRYTTEPEAAAPPVDESVYRLELWATTEAGPVKSV